MDNDTDTLPLLPVSQDELDRIFWLACDAFRSKIEATEYKNYLQVILFVKYISDVWTEQSARLEPAFGDDKQLIWPQLAQERFVLPEGCRFEDLYRQRHELNLGEIIDRALEQIEKANKVRLAGVFKHVSFNSEANLGQAIDRNVRIKAILEYFANPKLDVCSIQVGNLDAVGNAYEYLFNQFAAEDGLQGVKPFQLTQSLGLASLNLSQLEPQRKPATLEEMVSSLTRDIICALNAGDNITMSVMTRVARMVLRITDEHYLRLGLSQSKIAVLVYLSNEPELSASPSILARHCGISRAAMTGLLDGLEQENYVDRHIHPGDRRALMVKLTAKGTQFLDLIASQHQEQISELAGTLDEAERQKTIQLARAVLKSIEQQLIDRLSE